MYLIIGLIILVIIGAVTLTVIGLRNPELANERALQARLEEFSQTGEQFTLRDLELSQPFSERVIYPIARKLGELAIRFTPQNAMNNIEHKLELAGSPARLDATMILALQFLCALLFGGVVVIVTIFGSVDWSVGKKILIILICALVGFFFPQLWISSKI